MAPGKRKRDPLEGFDPNQSDPEDENFDPSEARPRRQKKALRAARKASGRTRHNRYRGSDIDEDDEELSDSVGEDSFGGDDSEDEDDEVPVNASGRRARKAAVHHPSYREESDDEIVNDSVANTDEEEPPKPKVRGKIVTLKLNQASRRGVKEPLPPAPSTRRTRAKTEEGDELVELTTSGRHQQSARASSRSKSPETLSRATRNTRAAKGIKKPITEPIEEASHETSFQPQEEPVEEPAEEAVEEADADADVVEDSAPEAAANQGDGEDVPTPVQGDIVMDEADGAAPPEQVAEEDSDDVLTGRRMTRSSRQGNSAPAAEDGEDESDVRPRRGTRLRRKGSDQGKKNSQDQSSDFEPEESAGEGSGSEKGAIAHDDDDDDGEYSSSRPSRGRSKAAARSQKRGRARETDDEMLDPDELAEEADDLRRTSRSQTRAARNRRQSTPIAYEVPSKRKRNKVDYTIRPFQQMDVEQEEEEPAPPAATPGRRKRGNGGGSDRYLNTTYGPFGGAGGLGSLLGGPWGTGAAGGVDSDSSDDEMGARYGVPGAVGVTPTAAAGPGLPQGAAATHLENLGLGATPNVGKVKNQKALADADPLGVDMTVDFNQVGGLAGHINQLKEMVQLPLLYPEVFQQFHVTPPRGVLFHGPPGTGKTLLARALANSIGSGGRKITFYMRKGADALSKWVGEAEKQLRLLFEEARKTQPSIIFFDEIDGLAPVRSSKQEQIHASIVSTLLALMDGMDGRGQVIVIGATNRPDNTDPALRRPGRFDREFYFPLPDVDGRKAILDIHTKDWGLAPDFKHSLAENTKGYGGADLRALCTEAALNAIQRTYPQIYSSEQKLVVDPSKISIHATDFMISIKKMVPSSERSASSGAAPLPKAVAPLLREQFVAIEETVKTILPLKPKITALEEAMYEPYEDSDHGFGRENLQQDFDRSRLFRPRMLIAGQPGMGQNYIASAILHHFERPPEQVITGMFSEVKRHKPSVVYIPHVDTWYATLGATALKVLTTMLMDIPPYEPVLLFGTADCEASELDRDVLRALFPFSRKNRVEIARPNSDNRMEFFSNMAMHVKKSPSEFPDPSTRKKRVLEELPVAPPPPPKPKSKAEIKSELKRDRQLLNHLKMRLQPVMDQLKKGKYRVFYKPMIPYDKIRYLFEEADPNYVSPDVPQHRPYIISKDSHGTEGLLEVDTGKFYYNLELITIEERLSNGYYARPKDFYRDIKTLVHDSKNVGDKDKILKSNEMESNVDVDMGEIENALGGPGPWEALHERQLRRAAEAAEKAKKKAAMQSAIGMIEDSESQVGPIRIGAPVPPESTTMARFRVMSPEERDPAGDSHMSNGNSVPSRLPEEGGGDEATQPFSQMGPPPVVQQRSSTTVSVRNAAGETQVSQVSQVSALTSLPQGVSPSAVLNEASTTNDPSTNKSSSNWSTQATNGFHGDVETTSQLPDTQPPGDHQSGPSQQTGSSHSPWMHSQADALAHGKLSNVGYGASNLQTSPTSSQVPTDRRASRIGLPNLLNDPVSVSDHSSVRNSGGSSSSSQHMPVVHDGQVQQFLNDLTERTSGCTIEQLEQINRELMDHIWLSRHEWNRMKVLNQLVKIFNDTISDIEEMQGVGQSSQELNDERAREYYSGSSRH
ncbi:TAT-binding protein-like protein 7, AAA ATPase [Diaporthe eres]|uniref:TAT-binding protein-like protein 7, AAA ATPase n=1 Tax=Diaporthe eres TaxID=83184 RepID=A0ABR1PJ02_DIAER